MLTLVSIMIVTAVFCWALSYYAHAHFIERWRLTLAVVAGLLPLLGAFLAQDAAAPLALCLLTATLINAELSLRFAKAWFALTALFAVLLVPAFVGQGVAIPALSAAAQSWAYVGTAAFLVLWRQRLKGLGDSFDAVGITGYLLAVLTALAYAMVDGPATTLAVGLLLAIGLYRVSRREPLPEAFVYVTTAIAGYALIQLTDIYSWPTSLNALILATFGSLLYLAGRRSESPRRAAPLRYAGLLLTFLGVYPGLLTQVPSIQPVVALAAGGILLWFEARWRGWIILQELSGATMVLAFDWLLRHEHVTQLQWYTLPAAGYFAYLVYRRCKLEHDAYDVFAVAALAFLTVPLAVQVFIQEGPAYGLLLVVEALALVIVGAGAGYRLITNWGLVMLTAGVLYQLPYLLSAVQELFSSFD